MKNSVFIRVDGSTKIGLGHLIRCIALAKMLKDDFDISFFCKEIPFEVLSELKNSGFVCTAIANEYEFLSQLKEKIIVVLDGYHFSTVYQKEIKAKGAKLVFIDDIYDKEFVADLIINHAPGVKSISYKAQPFTQFALGLDYALLRPTFLELARKERRIEKIETLMICIGGSDPKGISIRVLEIAIGYSQFKKIILVTGSAFLLTDKFSQLIGNDNRVQHRHALKEQEMANTMLESDLAIVSASSILLEILAVGCNVISGNYIDNQAILYENLKNNDFFVDAGDFSNKKLKEALNLALSGGLFNSKAIDGQSATRISKLFRQLNNEFIIKLRRSTKDDLDLTFRWAANSEIRRFSFQQHQITLEEHTNWFLRKIKDSNCYYYIVYYNEVPIGSIRFDIILGEAIISYLLDPAYHGMGYGQTILKKGIELLMIETGNDFTPIHIISGEVIKTNIPSIKAFERFGFIKNEQSEKYKFEKWI